MAPFLRKRNHEGKVNNGKVEKGNNSPVDDNNQLEDPIRIVTRSEGLNALESEGAMRTSVQRSEQSPHILDSLAWKTTRKRTPLLVKKTSDNWSKAAASLLGAHDADPVGNIDTVSEKLSSTETSGTSAIIEGKEELGDEPTVQNTNKRKRYKPLRCTY